MESQSSPRLPVVPEPVYTTISKAADAAASPIWMRRWEADRFSPVGVFTIGGGLLRAQGAVARDLFAASRLRLYTQGCTLLTLFATALYGAILGSSVGPAQVVPAAIKFPAVILASCGLCLPSFYIFQALAGARLTFQQALAAVMMLGAAAGLILLACAPIVWFFSVSTEGDASAFVAGLNAMVIGVSVAFGFHFLTRTHRYTAWKYGERMFDLRVMALWFALVLLVAAQMAHFIGPLDDERGWLGTERGFFLAALFAA